MFIVLIEKSRRTAAFLIAALSLGLLLPVMLTATGQAVSAQEAKPLVSGEVLTIKSKILGEERQLFVYTHPSYNDDDSRYPVAYVLDGEWNFRYTSGVIDLLSSREIIPWMIVVGILNVDRDKDLSPSPIKERPRGGGAALFRRFLRQEVFPLVEARYRTESFRLLIGHSLSGLFTVDTFLADPALCNAYLAVSPWLIWDQNRYLDEAVKKQALRPGRLTFLQVFLGAEPNLQPACDRLAKALTAGTAHDLQLGFHNLPDCDHETVFLPAVEQGLLDIFPDWRLPPAAAAAGLAGIRKHYDGLAARYGYEIRPVYFVLHMIGGDFIERDEIDEAIRILSYAASLNPGLPHAYESLGDCYRRQGKIEEAVRNYEIALQISPSNTNIRKVLDELKKK